MAYSINRGSWEEFLPKYIKNYPQINLLKITKLWDFW